MVGTGELSQSSVCSCQIASSRELGSLDSMDLLPFKEPQLPHSHLHQRAALVKLLGATQQSFHSVHSRPMFMVNTAFTIPASLLNL